MTPQTHVRLINTVLVLAVLTVLLLMLIGHYAKIDALVFSAVILFIGIPILGLILIYELPVQCINQGCMGELKPGWVREGTFDEIVWRLFYTCDACGSRYFSNFTIKFGGGDALP